MALKRMFRIFLPLLALLVFAAAVQADPNNPSRISFAPGATAAAVSGQIDPNNSADYVIYAQQGQVMQVALNWAGGPAYLTVVSPGGSPLARAQAGAQSFNGTLPETGDYHVSVSVFPGAPTTIYNMVVAISPLPPAGATAQAPVISTQRIAFAANTNTAQVVGVVNGDNNPTYNYYLLNAQAGQTMDIVLAQYTNPVYLSVVSPSGSPLARAQNGTQSFQQVLPESGDYQIRLSTASGTPVSAYELLVSVVNNGQQAGPQRLAYAPGTSTMTVNGQTSGTWVDNFPLNVQAGQQAQINVASPAGNVYISVIAPDGSPLVRAQNGAQSFAQTLAQSGDYRVEVSAPGGTAQTTYTLTVTVTGIGSGSAQGAGCSNVNQQVQFAAGATSAQVSGQMVANCTDTYKLHAAAGQYAEFVVASSTGTVYLTLVSPSGTPLARAQNGAQSFTGNLPEDGTYTIQLSSPAGAQPAQYQFTTAISPLPQSQGAGSAQRIAFAAGAVSAQVSGQVSGTVTTNYVLNARANQKMQLTLNWTGSPVYLTLVSPGGSPLARAQAGAQGFNGTLPENGDYRISISAPSGTPATNYTLTATVTN